MLRFMMLLCLCLFPFSGAWCEKQAAAEVPGRIRAGHLGRERG